MNDKHMEVNVKKWLELSNECELYTFGCASSIIYRLEQTSVILEIFRRDFLLEYVFNRIDVFCIFYRRAKYITFNFIKNYSLLSINNDSFNVGACSF